jgi:hypothetical protein
LSAICGFVPSITRRNFQLNATLIYILNLNLELEFKIITWLHVSTLYKSSSAKELKDVLQTGVTYEMA